MTQPPTVLPLPTGQGSGTGEKQRDQRLSRDLRPRGWPAMEPCDPRGKRVAVIGGGLVGNATELLHGCVCQGAGAVKALLECGGECSS